jgi:hypothetical protein
MGAVCLIYEQTDKGVKVIARIDGGRVSGRKARSITKLLKRFGFPKAPLEGVIDQLLLTQPGLGVAFFPGKTRQAR